MKLIVEQVPVKASLFSNEPPARTGHVFVYEGKNNRYITVREGQAISRAEMRSNGIFHRYTVKTGNHSFKSSTYDIGCQDLGRNFRFHFSVDLSVVEADKVVEQNLDNLETFFTNKVIKEFQPKISAYSFDQFNALKKDSVNFLNQTNIEREMRNAGIEVNNFIPTIYLSTEDFNHFKELEQLKKRQQIEKIKIESSVEVEELKQQKAIQQRKTQLLFEAQEKKFELETEIELDKLRNIRFQQLMEIHKDDLVAQTFILQGDEAGLSEHIKQKAQRQAELEMKEREALIEMAKNLDSKDITYGDKLNVLLNGNNRKDITPEPKKITTGGPSNKWETNITSDLDEEF